MEQIERATQAAMQATPDWLPALFASIDAQDVPRFLSFLAADARFRFGNLPAAVGHADIGAAVTGFFGSIAALRHELLQVWTAPAHVITEGVVHYTRLDGGKVSLPFVTVFGMEGTQIRDYLIYLDATPLYAPA
ncbi:MAG: nuclear transport factor 2 family protein [Steroidobacteraceae bacterium]